MTEQALEERLDINEINDAKMAERIAKLEQQVIDLTAVCAGLNKANKGLADFINSMTTNKTLLAAFMQNMILMYNDMERAMQVGGAFNYKLEWFNEPQAGSDVLGVHIAVNDAGVETTHVTQYQKNGEWQEIANTNETGPFHDWLTTMLKGTGRAPNHTYYVRCTLQTDASVDSQATLN